MKIIVCLLCITVIVLTEKIVTNELKSTATETIEFWTPEKMTKAKFIDIISVQNSTTESKIDRNTANTRECETPDKFPFSTVGRLFFQNERGDTFACTASAVKDDQLLTAGHCVSTGSGRWYKNILFCPQYKDGDCPKGKWTGKKQRSFDDWHRRRSLGRDVAFIITNEGGLKDKVGNIGVTWSKTRNNRVESMGYPANIGGGKRMIQTTAVQGPSRNCRPYCIRISTRMTQGSSGGPWILKSDAANGVNSFIVPTVPNVMFSPYFDKSVGVLFNHE
eukprot:gene3276-5719_t